MMRVGGGFLLFGYNGFSVIGFLLAFAASGWFLFQTFYRDRKDRKAAARGKPV